MHEVNREVTLWKELFFIALIGFNCYMITKANAATFDDCYSDTGLGMMFIAKLDPEDPQIKDLITNLCNFYYEKTGKWITQEDWFSGLQEQYGDEFYLKYKDSIPESMKQLFN